MRIKWPNFNLAVGGGGNNIADDACPQDEQFFDLQVLFSILKFVHAVFSRRGMVMHQGASVARSIHTLSASNVVVGIRESQRWD